MTVTRFGKAPTIVVIAGEASGDLHGARVVEAIKNRHPDCKIIGAGGNAMAAAGTELVVHAETLSVMGFTALFQKLPVILKALGRLKMLLSSLKPDLVILVDFPDFNLHLAAHAKRLQIPVLYYISPTIWAWRAKRIRKIKARVDHMAVILPFEKEIYATSNIPVTFVGHPLLDGAALPDIDAAVFGRRNGPFTLALLPGSREGEIRRLLPKMLAAVEILRRQIAPMQVVISRAPSIHTGLIEACLAEHGSEGLEISEDPVESIFSRSHFAVITSGTASLEAALAGIPMVIVYITSTLNYLLAKMLIKVPHIGLANLIARQDIVPELIQKGASAENIAKHVLEICNDPENYAKMRTRLLEIRKLMGNKGAAEQVARIADQLMANRVGSNRS